MRKKRTSEKPKKKLMTCKEVQQEFLPMDVRKLRTFLNTYCSFKKIGNVYYYNRSEVEKLLNDTENSFEFPIQY